MRFARPNADRPLGRPGVNFSYFSGLFCIKKVINSVPIPIPFSDSDSDSDSFFLVPIPIPMPHLSDSFPKIQGYFNSPLRPPT